MELLPPRHRPHNRLLGPILGPNLRLLRRRRRLHSRHKRPLHRKHRHRRCHILGNAAAATVHGYFGGAVAGSDADAGGVGYVELAGRGGG